MTISFSGLASGLDTSSWVEALVAVKQNKITTLKSDLSVLNGKKSSISNTRSIFSSFRTSLEKLTDVKFGGTFDLFGQNSATSSNEEVFTATATSDAIRQDYTIKVNQLATYTKATSLNSASSVADDSSVLKNLGITEGSMSVYVNGVKTTINIEEGDTLGDLKSQLATAGINASINQSGFLELTAFNEGDTVNIGATTDTSNLQSLFGLTKDENSESYLSSNALFKASTASVLTSADAGFSSAITEGTFTIGNATFTINSETTLSSLISQINSNKDAQANAYWDDATGKLNITSKVEGASYINIEAGTSNFTDVMNLTTTQRDENGEIVSTRMYTESQELGKNAIFSINGTSMTSTSNTVNSDISRIAGVTINLKRTSTEDDGESKLSVSQNTTGLVDAVKAFVDSYNKVINEIDTVTAAGGALERDTSLNSFKNTIRNYATGSNDSNGGIYRLLSEIGISTASADSNNLSTDTNQLQLDETKLLKALEENPESVEAMLGGENGVLKLMENSVEQMLSASTGYFDIQTSTVNSDIKRMEDKISKQQSKIDSYRTSLENKFYAMEQAIAQMQQNYSNFTTT